jgi:hypothetical protein
MGERWAFEELQDEGLDERTRLIRAFDRRQLGVPLQQQLDEKLALLCVEGRSQNVLRAATGPLSSVGELLMGWKFFEWLDTARTVGRRPQASQLQVVNQIEISRDIFGNPFRPVTFDPDWRTSTAVALAKQMYDSRDFSAMPILADALQDAGCEHVDVLTHCRDAKGVHVRGCWVVDLVLGKV